MDSRPRRSSPAWMRFPRGVRQGGGSNVDDTYKTSHHEFVHVFVRSPALASGVADAMTPTVFDAQPLDLPASSPCAVDDARTGFRRCPPSPPSDLHALRRPSMRTVADDFRPAMHDECDVARPRARDHATLSCYTTSAVRDGPAPAFRIAKIKPLRARECPRTPGGIFACILMLEDVLRRMRLQDCFPRMPHGRPRHWSSVSRTRCCGRKLHGAVLGFADISAGRLSKPEGLRGAARCARGVHELGWLVLCAVEETKARTARLHTRLVPCYAGPGPRRVEQGCVEINYPNYTLPVSADIATPSQVSSDPGSRFRVQRQAPDGGDERCAWAPYALILGSLSGLKAAIVTVPKPRTDDRPSCDHNRFYTWAHPSMTFSELWRHPDVLAPPARRRRRRIRFVVLQLGLKRPSTDWEVGSNGVTEATAQSNYDNLTAKAEKGLIIVLSWVRVMGGEDGDHGAASAFFVGWHNEPRSAAPSRAHGLRLLGLGRVSMHTRRTSAARALRLRICEDLGKDGQDLGEHGDADEHGGASASSWATGVRSAAPSLLSASPLCACLHLVPVGVARNKTQPDQETNYTQPNFSAYIANRTSASCPGSSAGSSGSGSSGSGAGFGSGSGSGSGSQVTGTGSARGCACLPSRWCLRS
ncbi:hypothetical protein DFH09DRAFT_1355033 [Mycena vulgaris]|nr:hypothetical protein DFH09DRAFT_1355033 [Mycena vulgaris]